MRDAGGTSRQINTGMKDWIQGYMRDIGGYKQTEEYRDEGLDIGIQEKYRDTVVIQRDTGGTSRQMNTGMKDWIQGYRRDIGIQEGYGGTSRQSNTGMND